ncbi:Short-chain dehydrogenase TIC 32, chloroplastic [Linum grandiflorum]
MQKYYKTEVAKEVKCSPEKCGFLGGRVNQDSQLVQQLKKLPVGLMGPASLVLLQVGFLHPEMKTKALMRYAFVLLLDYFPDAGATSGLGLEATRVLALRGVHVVMAVRDVDAGYEVRRSIIEGIPNAKLDVMKLDLSSLASVREFASGFISTGLPLNILLNNAGIMACPFSLSEDNVELQFASNHLGHFLLTNLLLETMKKTAHSSNRKGRIVIVGSLAHYFTYKEVIRFDRINDESGYFDMRAYGQSKLANILHAKELARRLKEDDANITVNSLHPGSIVTNLLRYHSFVNLLARVFVKFALKNVQQGAATSCYLALHPQVKGVTGKHFMDCNLAEPNSHGNDMNLAKKLWDFSLSLTTSRVKVTSNQ